MTLEAAVAACEAELLLADSSGEPDTSAILDRLLADHVVMLGPGDEPISKSFILDAHRPPRKQAFVSVTVRDSRTIAAGDMAVVTCLTDYETAERRFTLRFLRVWRQTASGWRVVVGQIRPGDAGTTSA